MSRGIAIIALEIVSNHTFSPREVKRSHKTVFWRASMYRFWIKLRLFLEEEKSRDTFSIDFLKREEVHSNAMKKPVVAVPKRVSSKALEDPLSWVVQNYYIVKTPELISCCRIASQRLYDFLPVVYTYLEHRRIFSLTYLFTVSLFDVKWAIENTQVSIWQFTACHISSGVFFRDTSSCY